MQLMLMKQIVKVNIIFYVPMVIVTASYKLDIYFVYEKTKFS